jgi:glycosyltransferase involved in cell wall biosynthesis
MANLKLLLRENVLPYLIRDINYPVGGATIEWFSWIKGITENNCQVGILTWKGAKDYISHEVPFDIVETYKLSGGIPKIRWIYDRFPSMIKAVKNYNPDFIISECAGFDTGNMAMISKLTSTKFVYRIASNMETDGGYKTILSKAEQLGFEFGISMADIVLCQNEYQYKNIKLKYPQKECLVIHNPFYVKHSQNSNGDHNRKEYVAWLGNFRYQKNLMALLKTVESLPNTEFKIAGMPLPNIDQETSLALNKLKTCKNVNFLGYLKRTEVLPFLSKAKLLLNTSRIEGFSNTFLEAFSVGTPVITLTHIDPDNIISKNNIGRVVDNTSKLSNEITNLINDDNYHSFSKNCKKYLIDNHNPSVLSKKLIEYLEIQ